MFVSIPGGLGAAADDGSARQDFQLDLLPWKVLGC
jgi:hypothetical protein